MPNEKKTEQQLREEIITEYGFEESDDRIDKILKIKKDRYSATQGKKKAQKEAEDFKQGKEWYKAKSAKKEGGDSPKDKEKPNEATLTSKDQFVLLKEGVDVEDIDRIIKFSKDEDISISKALQNKELKAILGVRKEERTTANATNTGGGKRGTSKTSGDTMLADFEKSGKLPENDSDFDKIAEARITRMKKRD